MGPFTISAFPYPTASHVRKHGPDGYSDYGAFKPWLRDEYSFRCVYCLFRETWFPNGADSFSVDHFVAKADGGQRVTYGNLFYACMKCNLLKGRKVGLLNSDENGYGNHIKQLDDGRVEALTPHGGIMIDFLKLNARQRIDERAQVLRWIKIAARMDGEGDQEMKETLLLILLKEFGYPEDLPDLSRERPPKGNAKKEGISRSYHAMRTRGELGPTY